MRILMAASEMVPFAKSGGLGDVLGALPPALSRLGHEVKVFIPHYASIDTSAFDFQPVDLDLQVEVAGKSMPMKVSQYLEPKSGMEVYLLGNATLFERPDLYVDPATGKDFVDNDERFIFFCRGGLELCRKIGFWPDVVHAHDWQAGLLPIYLKTLYSEDSYFAGVKSVLTIHNLAYQGTFPAESFPKLNLPPEMFYATSPFEFYGQLNLLKASIVYADKITAVSERYAREIRSSSELGCGLEGVLTERKDDLVGILNGVDYTIWSPSRDKNIPFKYHRANLSGKKMNKVDLLNESSLPIRDKTPLIGVISRLVDQKGFDLVAEAAERILAMDIQMIVLGTGDEKYHSLFSELEQKYPDKIKAYLTFDDALAHRIEAASDIFLMPSRFEPCGLNQMYSLKYGTVPLVREVGGLADTVVDFDPTTGEGTGFVFKEYTADALVSTLERAVATYSRRRVWTKIMKSAMLQDFSWRRSAERYADLYAGLIGSRG